MTDYQALVSEMRDRHCGACAAGLAIRAVEELARIQAPLVPVKPDQTQPKPKKAVKVHKQPRLVVKGRTEKACNACRVIKPITAYPKHKSCADGHTGTCAACTSERLKRNYQASQARKKGNMLLENIAADTKKLHNFRCVICHANFLSQEKLDEHNHGRHGG